ncbi:MAG: hypothetical protein AAGG55_17415 [Pseudomonadota bacterium]
MPRLVRQRKRDIARHTPHRGGRREVREAIYIALTVSRRVPSLIAMRDRMRATGKAPKTILIAVARQLRVINKAMLRTKTPFAP